MHRPAEATVPQDWERLARWFAARGEHLDLDASPPRQLAGGLANLNYEITVDGRPVVLRRPPAGPLPQGANDMVREHGVLRRLAPAYPLAPRALGLCDDPNVLGAPFQLLERRTGESVGSERPVWIPDGDAAGPLALCRAVVEALVALHDLDADAVGLGELGRPAGFLERQLVGWCRRAHAAWDGAPPPLVESLTGELRASLPVEHPPVLLHLDWKVDNLLFDADRRRPSAVLDWDMATRGDPHVDLGVMLAYWIQPGDPAELHELGQSPALVRGFPDRRALVDAYAEHRDVRPETLATCVTFGRLRLAVVFQQLSRLPRTGAAHDDRYRTFSALAHRVLEWAHDARQEIA